MATAVVDCFKLYKQNSWLCHNLNRLWDKEYKICNNINLVAFCCKYIHKKFNSTVSAKYDLEIGR